MSNMTETFPDIDWVLKPFVYDRMWDLVGKWESLNDKIHKIDQDLQNDISAQENVSKSIMPNKIEIVGERAGIRGMFMAEPRRLQHAANLEDVARPERMYREVSTRALYHARALAVMIGSTNLHGIPGSGNGAIEQVDKLPRDLVKELWDDVKPALREKMKQIALIHEQAKVYISEYCLDSASHNKSFADPCDVHAAAIMMLSCNQACTKWERTMNETGFLKDFWKQEVVGPVDFAIQYEDWESVKKRFIEFAERLSPDSINPGNLICRLMEKDSENIEPAQLAEFQPISKKTLDLMRLAAKHVKDNQPDLNSAEIFEQHLSTLDVGDTITEGLTIDRFNEEYENNLKSIMTQKEYETYQAKDQARKRSRDPFRPSPRSQVWDQPTRRDLNLKGFDH